MDEDFDALALQSADIFADEANGVAHDELLLPASISNSPSLRQEDVAIRERSLSRDTNLSKGLSQSPRKLPISTEEVCELW